MPQPAESFFSGFTPAKRDTPWSVGGGSPYQQEPVKLPSGGLIPEDPDVRQTLIETADKYKINPAVLMAMAHQESGYNAQAVGPDTPWGKAVGMFQFLQSTAKNHGIDPLDYRQAADAAARDLAEQIAREGVDWAVAHHHAGPNKKLHGKKTKQYVREVLAKAQVIAKELGIDFQLPDSAKPDFSNVQGTPKPSAEQFFGTPAAQTDPSTGEVTEDAGPETLGETFRKRLAGAAAESPMGIDPVTGAVAGAIKRTFDRGWEGIQNFLNRETVQVERTDSELRRLWEENKLAQSPAVLRGGLTFEQWANQNRMATVTAKTFEDEEAEWKARLATNPDDAYLLPKRLSHLRPKADESRFAPADTFTGAMQRIIANHKNPLDLMLQDSIPANIVTTLFTLPELERKKFDQARQITKALEVTNEPEKYSSDELAQAQQVVGNWQKEANKGVVEAWQELYQAAKEDPAQVATAFSEALVADPYLMAAPVGVGIKPVRALQAAQGIRAATIAGRAAKIADRILDAGSTAAVLNVAAGAASNLAEQGKVNSDEVKLNAAMGFLLGGALGPVFTRGAKAKAKDLNAAKLEGVYEETLADMAKADVQMEATVRKTFDPDFGVGPKQTELQRQLGELLGIRTTKDRDAWIKQRRKEIKSTFTNEADYADYLKYVAQERTERARLLADEEAAAQRQRAEAAWGVSPEDAAARRARMSEEFDKAIIARNEAEAATDADSMIKAAQEEDRARTLAQQLDAEELYYAMLAEDAPAVRQAEAAAKRREGVLKTPKWQRGEASPETLARLGAVGLGAAAGYAAFPQDEKLQGTLLGGLAGLIIPAGGSVLSRMRQAGAISSDGQIISALTKAGKLATKLDEAEIKARDAAWIDLARSGDQAGFKNLYDTYYPKIKRFANKYMANRESAIGLDADDIAQQAFIKVYQKMIDDPDFTVDNFPAFVTRVAENEALQAIRKAGSQREGADVVNESVTRRFDDEGNELSGRSIMDTTAGSPDYNVGLEGLRDTPELTAIRDESMDIIRQAFDKLPNDTQRVMTLAHAENYLAREISEQLKMPLNTVLSHLKRGEDIVRRSIQENRRKLGEPVTVPRSQRGSADPATLKKLALASVGAGTGLALGLRDDSPVWGLGVGTVAGLLLSGSAGAGLVRGVDKALGISSTRVKNHSEAIHRSVVNMLRKEMERVHRSFEQTDPFIKNFNKLNKSEQDILHRALSTGSKPVIEKMLGLFDQKVPGIKAAYTNAHKVIETVGDELEKLSRIKRNKAREYFPRVVIDYDGLVRFISKTPNGKEVVEKLQAALQEAEAKSIKANSRPLTEVEKSDLINQILFTEKKSLQPDWAKNRVIEEITPELLPFYASPAEALHTYLKSAIQDIERSKFFGKYAKTSKKKDLEFLDTERSINNLIADQLKEGKLTDAGAYEVSSILKSLFADKQSNTFISSFKNLSYAGLLGNIGSAAVQIGDIIMQGFTQDIRSTLEALVRQATGKKFVDMREFGLADSVTAEFANQARSSKLLSKYLLYSVFSGVDRFGKNTALNAAIIRAKRLAKTDGGKARLANKYAEAFGDDFNKLVSDLKSGKITDLTKEYAFLELSRSQPITKFEMSQMWLDSPNAGRTALMLKSFMLKQLDLARREGYNQIKKGNVAVGLANLTKLSIFLGLAGTSSDAIKHFLSEGADTLITGDPVEGYDVELLDIPLNALRTFGMTEYVRNKFLGVTKEEAAERRAAGDKGARSQKANPVQATTDYFTPPARMWVEMATGNPNMYRYLIPVVGPYVADQMRKLDAEQKALEVKRNSSSGRGR